MTVLDDVLSDLRVEGDQIEGWVRPLDEEQWRLATPAAGWDIATTVGHLAWTDSVVVVAATDKVGWDQLVLRAIEDPTGFVDSEAANAARAPGAQILDAWTHARAELDRTLRDYPAGEKVPWFGPPMSPVSMATARFMETWAHGLDVADTLGITVEPTDRIRHVAHIGVRTRNYSFTNNNLEPPIDEFHIALRSPSGELWEWGPDDATQRVTGSAWDFALLVTHRAHRDDLDIAAVGVDADRWLDVAQAFAGPPGEKRAPRGSTDQNDEEHP